MAYTFHSRATADLIMLKATAEQILKLLDKPVHEPGILTVEQIPQAIATLKQAVQEDEERRQAIKAAMQGDHEDNAALQKLIAADSERLGPISLRQRVVPLIDMLQDSAAENKPVTWTFA